MSTKNKQAAYLLEIEDALQEYSATTTGLTDHEATKRQQKYGPNALAVERRETWAHKYLRQFKDLMVLLLLVSSVISWYLGDTRTAIILGILVLFNTLIGFFQEFRAEKTMQALERLVTPQAQVYRNGNLKQVASKELVPGDIIRLVEGDAVPADVRIIEELSFSTNDFALTGESNPSRKFTRALPHHVPLNNRHNLAFMGTTVATGEAKGLVIATGASTELGRIASLSQATPSEMSPLQRELQHIATRVTYGVVLLCLVLLFVAIQSDMAIKDAFLFAIGFASSLVPQGLPAEINTSLAQAAGKLARAKALVKRLSAVETLGATHIICTDKTGTLTKNQMTVQKFIVGRHYYEATGTGYAPRGLIQKNGKAVTAKEREHLEEFLVSGALASNAKVLPPDDAHADWHCLGDPTEGALITLARKASLPLEKWQTRLPEVRELTFDSARKRMTSVRQAGERTAVAYVKGALESVLEKSTHIWDGQKTRAITEADRQWLLEQNDTLARDAMRNLGYAKRELPLATAKKASLAEIEEKLTFLGMVSMIDPLRDEVPAAMAAARQAHIKVTIVTGDFALTAEAIARKAGLDAAHGLTTISGEQLVTMSDEVVLKHVQRGATIFSRVSPEDKMRIVSLVKQAGQVVAVTGDGINDAPALKRADIGVAMGITGTDVAKQSSEVILLDDSFATLMNAVRYGRTIFANIKKSTLSCFTSNFAELVVNLASLGAASLLGIPLAIGIIQILAIDLLAELFPIAALGWDKAEGETMKAQPRHPKEHILSWQNIADLAWCGLLIGGLAFMNYLLFYGRAGVDAQAVDATSLLYFQATTITYLTIVLCQLVNIMQRRSVHGFFTAYQFHNWHFWAAIAFSLSCVLVIIYNPIIANYFKTGPPGWIDWLYAFGAAVIFLLVREMQRLYKQKRSLH
ncbi:MAG TPA: cation-transporting P-type ATPase [Verrucomicrobiae bacterium]|nr:cation-transporting P-type ATPase [Verrucomicrobiae bacterium]